MARAIFMYSFPAEHKGATRDDVKRAAFTTVCGHHQVGDMLETLRRQLFYLELTDDQMFRFTSNENINSVLDRAKRSVSDTDAMERKKLQERAGSKFRRTYVWPDHTTKIEDIPGLQLIIMRTADIDYCKKTVTNITTKSARVNQNALVFILPGVDGVLQNAIRELLAIRDVRQRTPLKPVDEAILDKAEMGCQGGIESGLHKKYADVWLPNRNYTIQKYNISSTHPKDEKRPLGDVIWEKLVGVYQISERLDSGLFDKYDGTPEDKFDSMMRTCGERRPASLSVVRDAMTRATESPTRKPPTRATESPTRKPPVDLTGSVHTTIGQSEVDVTESPPIDGVHCSGVIDRENLNWVGGLFNTLNDVATTTLKFNVDQKSGNEFNIQLDVNGKIPRKIADDIKESISHDWEYKEDESW